MSGPHGYPRERARPPGAPFASDRKFARIESSYPEVSAGDTDTFVYDFSGTPDAMRLTSRSNGALFTLTDVLERETHEVAVLANESVMIPLGRRRVNARNLVGGSVALVFVEGYWLSPLEAVDGLGTGPNESAPLNPGAELSPAEAGSVNPGSPSPREAPARFRWR